jgi:hypothetical protein
VAKRRPTVTPIMPRGMVSRMMIGRRIELNWATSRKRMIRPAMGSLAAIESLALAEVSASPPARRDSPAPSPAPRPPAMG